MKQSALTRMDLWARHLLPFGVSLLLVLLTAAPTHLPAFSGIAPVLGLVSVFYWSIYRPDLLPPYAAFLLGLLSDIVSGLPIGVSAFVLLLVQGVTASQRRFFITRTFLVAWWGFGMVSAAAFGVSWLLLGVLFDRVVDNQALMFEFLMTLAVYPVLAWTLARTQVAFLKNA